MRIFNPKRAYISIEEGLTRIAIDGDRYYTIPSEQIIDFLKERKIKEIFVCKSFPEIISLRVNLSNIANPQKKVKIVRATISSEIRKTYFPKGHFVYNYKLLKNEAGNYARAYVVGEDSLTYFDSLLTAGYEIKAFVPSFAPIIALLKDRGVSFDGNFLVLLHTVNFRHIFAFSGQEMLLERSYQADTPNITEEDESNIKMTINYTFQNLRILPERVIFVGFDRTNLEGLNMEYEFVEVESSVREYILCHSLSTYSKKILNDSLTPDDYSIFLKKRLLFKFATPLIAVISTIFFALSFNKTFSIASTYESIKRDKAQIKAMSVNLDDLVAKIENFEKKVLPIVLLQNKKFSEPSVRSTLKPLSEVSRISGVFLSLIEVENSPNRKIKVSGKIKISGITERQLTYNDIKQRVQQSGFKIIIEKFDFTGEDFYLEITNESGRLL